MIKGLLFWSFTVNIFFFQLIICISMEKKEQKSFKYWVNSGTELFLLSEYVVLNYVGS